MSLNTPTAYLEQDISGEKRRFPLEAERVLRIGRSASKNDIVLDDTLASREHAILQRSDAGAFYLTDLNSSNGTVVNGLRITRPVILRCGDRVTIGRYEFLFYQDAVPAPPEPPVSEESATTMFRVSRLITVLVADIFGFTRLAQILDPDTVAHLTSSFFRQSGRVLQERGAWAQKYIGDAVMAVWVHNGREPELSEFVPVFDGVRRLAEVAGGLQEQFGLESPVRIGAGINTGLASVGNVGSIVSSDYTALGEVVNKAFRFESATREVSCDLLIGQTTLDSLAHACNVNDFFQTCTVALKGYDGPTTAHGMRFSDLDRLLAKLRGGPVKRPAF